MAKMQATPMNAKIERLCRDVKERERTALNQSNNGLLAINVPKRLVDRSRWIAFDIHPQRIPTPSHTSPTDQHGTRQLPRLEFRLGD